MNRGSDTLARLARLWRDCGAIGAMGQRCELAGSWKYRMPENDPKMDRMTRIAASKRGTIL
jgi:hypothetical protein